MRLARTLPALAAMLCAWVVLGGAGTAGAQNLTLTVNPNAISFPDANPDLTPQVTSVPATVTVTVRVVGNGNNPWRLTLAANGPLQSGASTIAVNNVTWTTSPAAPPWTAGGTLALAPGQTVASGTGNVNNTVGTLSFRLANSWTYAVGNYTTSATFTLTAP